MYGQINRGDKVCWNIGEMQVKGLVVDMYKHRISRASTSSIYTKNHSPEGIRNALLIELEDGRKVLKLEDEVTRVW